MATAVNGHDLLRIIDPTPTGVPGSVRALAVSGVNVVIVGETGVGKEVLAETIHALSGRPGALVRIQCAALTERARLGATPGTTVFLDELGELAAGIETELLAMADVRFIATTAAVVACRWLDGVTLTIPPLRERRQQIGPLALGFLTPPLELRPEVLAALEAHDWPGNVRELKAVVERAVLLARGAEPAVRHLTFAPVSCPGRLRRSSRETAGSRRG